MYTSFNGPITVQSIPQPSLQDESSIIVQVMATGVCRSDWHGWKGHDDDIAKHGLPFIPGHEFSGVIIERGNKVRSLKVGDRVAIPFILSCGHCSECNLHKPTVCLNQSQPGFTMPGSFAEFVCIPRADRNVRVIPPKVSFVEAAALGCRFTTAYRAIVQQGLGLTGVGLGITAQRSSKPKKTVCIFGCGGLGMSCIMIAKAYQEEGNIGSIIAVDVSSKVLEKAVELGADKVVNVTILKNDDNEIRRYVLELTNGLGADLTVDAAGFASTSENAIYCTRRGGRMVQVGLPIGGRSPDVPMGMVVAKELEIVGSHGFAATELPDLLQLVATKKLDVKKLIEQESTLTEGAEALMAMDHGSPLGMTMITTFDENNNNSKL